MNDLERLVQSLKDGTWEPSPGLLEAAEEAIRRMDREPRMTDEEAVAASVAFILDTRLGGR